MKQLGLIMSAVLCFQMLFSQPLLGQYLKDDDSSKQEIEISYDDEEDTNMGNMTQQMPCHMIHINKGRILFILICRCSLI